jgi:hypothetical protein
MTYRKNFEYVERRVGSVPTDNSTVPYFNASMIIRIPIQPMRSVFIVSRYEYLLVLFIVLFTCLYRTQLILFGRPSLFNRYTPTVSAVLKNAWIQYISFFAVISFLLFRLNSFVFRHKVWKYCHSYDIFVSYTVTIYHLPYCNLFLLSSCYIRI